MLIHSLRVSVGDLKNVEYQNWADKSDGEKKDFKFSSFWADKFDGEKKDLKFSSTS